jgi:hypothetical protein
MSDLSAYRDLINGKTVRFEPRGLSTIPLLNAALRPHQAHSVEFALRAGSAALFLDTGLGKTLCALEWGRVIVGHTGKPVLMLAPLAVSAQHEREAIKFGIDAKAVREGSEISGPRVYITNYERLHKFDASIFSGVILDESSVLKAMMGKTARALIETFSETPYRLACTATPAPNDHAELGMHSEFLGALSQSQMLTRWFIHDSMDTGTWRLKGHAVEPFWSWVASWSRCLSMPSDLGLDDTGYDLPPLQVQRHLIKADTTTDTGAEKEGQFRLFRIPDVSATSIHKEKRLTTNERAKVIADLVKAEPAESWIIWTDTDYEADAVAALLPDAVEVRGSMSPDAKEAGLIAFSSGAERVIITKPSVAGYGLNWQHCARVGFVGLSFSYENYYQAIRRTWRFGQTRPVHVHIACSDTEENVWQVVQRKAGDHEMMKREMRAAIKRAVLTQSETLTYQPKLRGTLPAWFAA